MDKFSWSAVATSAAGSFVGAGLGGLGVGGGVASALRSSGWAATAISAGVNSGISQSIMSAAGAGSFSWRNVAVSAIAAPITQAIGDSIFGTVNQATGAVTSSGAAWAQGNETAANLVNNFLGGSINQLARATVYGRSDSWRDAGLNMLGETLGNGLAGSGRAVYRQDADPEISRFDRALKGKNGTNYFRGSLQEFGDINQLNISSLVKTPEGQAALAKYSQAAANSDRFEDRVVNGFIDTDSGDHHLFTPDMAYSYKLESQLEVTHVYGNRNGGPADPVNHPEAYGFTPWDAVPYLQQQAEAQREQLQLQAEYNQQLSASGYRHADLDLGRRAFPDSPWAQIPDMQASGLGAGLNTAGTVAGMATGIKAAQLLYRGGSLLAGGLAGLTADATYQGVQIGAYRQSNGRYGAEFNATELAFSTGFGVLGGAFVSGRLPTVSGGPAAGGLRAQYGGVNLGGGSANSGVTTADEFLIANRIADPALRQKIIDSGLRTDLLDPNLVPATFARFDRLFPQSIAKGRSFSGRLGNIDTRVATINEASQLEMAGLIPRFEFPVSVGAGKNRAVDLVGLDQSRQPVTFVQFVKKNSNGVVLRPDELAAARQIEKSLNLAPNTVKLINTKR